MENFYELGETRSLESEYKAIGYIYLTLHVLQAGNLDNLSIITMQCYQKSFYFFLITTSH